MHLRWNNYKTHITIARTEVISVYSLPKVTPKKVIKTERERERQFT